MNTNYTKEQISLARKYATQVHLDYIEAIDKNEAGFASHVTEEKIQEIRAQKLNYIQEILDGKHDGNFSVWQRMNYYLTGECVPFLK